MKRITIIVTINFILMILLCGCIMILPSKDSIGESKVFDNEKFSIVLTDAFVEQESEKGFDAYYTSDFCGVLVEITPFGIDGTSEDMTEEEYLLTMLEANGYSDIKPQNRDGMWYYKSVAQNTCGYIYCIKGSEEFYGVQFRCYISDASRLEDFFYICASSVELK